MNELCDKLIAEMAECKEDSALLTGIDSFNTIKEAKQMAESHGQFNGKATIAWRRGSEWLTFSFKKDEDCESGWAINVRWLADKPSWIKTPERPRMRQMWIPEHLVPSVVELLNRKDQP